MKGEEEGNGPAQFRQRVEMRLKSFHGYRQWEEQQRHVPASKKFALPELNLYRTFQFFIILPRHQPAAVVAGAWRKLSLTFLLSRWHLTLGTHFPRMTEHTIGYGGRQHPPIQQFTCTLGHIQFVPEASCVIGGVCFRLQNALQYIRFGSIVDQLLFAAWSFHGTRTAARGLGRKIFRICWKEEGRKVIPQFYMGSLTRGVILSHRVFWQLSPLRLLFYALLKWNDAPFNNPLKSFKFATKMVKDLQIRPISTSVATSSLSILNV